MIKETYTNNIRTQINNKKKTIFSLHKNESTDLSVMNIRYKINETMYLVVTCDT